MNNLTENKEIFDKIEYMHRMMDDEMLALEIMSEFIVDMENQLRHLREQVDSADMATLVRLAHTVKGASANVGAKTMQQTAFAAEKAASQQDRDEFRRLVPEIESSFAALQGLLHETGFLAS